MGNIIAVSALITPKPLRVKSYPQERREAAMKPLPGFYFSLL
jgi:hypothetical protein